MSLQNKMVSLFPFNKLEDFRTKRVGKSPYSFLLQQEWCVYYQRQLQELKKKKLTLIDLFSHWNYLLLHSHILLWRLDVIGYSCFFIELVSLGEKEVGGQGSAPSQIVLLLEKALFAFGWSSLPSLHCSPKSPLPPTCPPRNPCLGAERWGLEDAAGHGDPSTCSQGFSGSRWSGLRHLRQEMNHLTLGWLIILPSLFSIFSQQSLFSPTKNYFKKSHREV